MSAESPVTPPVPPEIRRTLTLWAVRAVSRTVIYGLILFLSAGRLDWVWGWVQLGLLALVTIAHPLLLVPSNPELLVERERGLWPKGVKGWDRWITALLGALMPLPWIVAGLAVRFQWTAPFPLAVHVVGLLVEGLGYALYMWAMAANPFFSAGVRIQTERGHVVTSGGPYRCVRHPGYLGAILTQIGTPLLLGSAWAFVPASISVLLFIVRTLLEDRTLTNELPGYQAYAQQTRSRLLPGVW